MVRMSPSRMYPKTKTWNPFKGCLFDCIYCEPSFKRICRLYNKCPLCKQYLPHEHPERLEKVPKAKIVFVAGNGDLSFCRPEFILRIIETIKKYPDRTFYLQSKNPRIFYKYIPHLTSNIILVTTLETNRDEGYYKISKALPPTQRFIDFVALPYPRKVVTAEPLMDFDLDEFVERMLLINPEYVWVGYNSRPKDVQLPEPSIEKTMKFIHKLIEANIEVRGKDLRGIETLI